MESSNKSGFHLQLRIRQHLNLTIKMFYHLFVESTKLLIGIQNSIEDQKKGIAADSPTNLILACCEFRLQCRKCTVWPRNEHLIFFENHPPHANKAQKDTFCSW